MTGEVLVECKARSNECEIQFGPARKRLANEIELRLSAMQSRHIGRQL